MSQENVSRRNFLKIIGGAVVLFGAAIAGLIISSRGQERSFLDRLMGIPLTDEPENPNAWTYAEQIVTVSLSQIPELTPTGSAVRIEGESLPQSLLVVHGDDNNYYAYKNACTHAGRKIDPIAGTLTLECCSASGSTFDYDGNVLSGPASAPLTLYPVTVNAGELVIDLA